VERPLSGGLNCPEPLMSLNDEHLHNKLDISMQDISKTRTTEPSKSWRMAKQQVLMKFSQSSLSTENQQCLTSQDFAIKSGKTRNKSAWIPAARLLVEPQNPNANSCWPRVPRVSTNNWSWLLRYFTSYRVNSKVVTHIHVIHTYGHIDIIQYIPCRSANKANSAFHPLGVD